MKNADKHSADPGQPAASEGLSREAKALWADLVREYAVTDAAGLAVLRVGLEAFDRMRSAQAEIKKDGQQVRDRFNQPKPHPLLTVERDSRAQFLMAMKALHFDVEPLRDRPGRPGGA